MRRDAPGVVLETAVPVDVLTEIVIDRPAAEVAGYAGDPGNAPKWYVNIKSVEWETPPPLAVGSRLAFVAHFFEKPLGSPRFRRVIRVRCSPAGSQV